MSVREYGSKVEAFFMVGNEFSRAGFVWEAKLRNLHVPAPEGYVSLARSFPEFN